MSPPPLTKRHARQHAAPLVALLPTFALAACAHPPTSPDGVTIDTATMRAVASCPHVPVQTGGGVDAGQRRSLGATEPLPRHPPAGVQTSAAMSISERTDRVALGSVLEFRDRY